MFVRTVQRVAAGLFVMMVCIAIGSAQQLPPGTRSADDRSREDAEARQLADAESSLEHGDFVGAETKLKALAQARPKDARVLYDLGFAAEHNDEDDAAAKAYAGAIAADGTLAEPKVALGLLDARVGRTKEAREELLGATNLSTAAPALRARAFRALAKLEDGNDPVTAQTELLEALKLSPETPADALLGAELAEQMGAAALAETAFRRALTLMPGDVEATAGLAHVLAQQKKLAEADLVVSAGLQAHPGDPRLVAQAVPIYLAEGDTAGKAAQAIPMLEQLRKSDPKFAADPEMTRVLAHLYESQGEEAKAEALYLSAVTTTPNDPALLDDLGSAQVRLQQFAQAEATLRKAFTMRKEFDDDDRWGEAAEHLAFAASKNNDPTMALQALAARATVLPNSPSSLFLEAISHDTLHQAKEARESYKAFLAAAGGRFPDQEFEARHRLVALEHVK